jgi:protein-S-isoprenylcysteine O-methyltransferase Ste14
VLTGGFAVGDALPSSWLVRGVGVVLIALGAAVVADGVVRFVREGAGTPSPLAPAARLVVRGPYRWVRNPMYLATTVALVGEALLLRRAILLLAAAAYLTTFLVLVRVHEEPLLRRRFGAAWDDYRTRVPAWLPGLARRPPRGRRTR